MVRVWRRRCSGEPEEGFGDLVVAEGNATEPLKAIEHPLDVVAILVAPEVAGNGPGAVRPAGYRE